VAIFSADKLTATFIIGSAVVISLPTADIMSAVWLLFVCYYIFDIDYPRVFCNFFCMLQTLAVGEAYTKPCSKRCKFFLKKLRTQMDDLPEPPRSQDANLPDLQP